MAKGKVVRWEPARSVGWYDPRQLARTGIRIAASELFAKHADLRLLYPYLHPKETTFVVENLLPCAKSITLDYIADTGDGFDASYAMAFVATEKNLADLNPTIHDQLKLELKRSLGAQPDDALVEALQAPGQILVLGGDEVYPTGTKSDYQQRFVVPFECASAELSEKRFAFSIPGNHDWYENLTAFNEIFLREKKVGAWDTVQKRSYFALQLPHDWWVFATDMQLESDLDGRQLEYFLELTGRLSPRSKVILLHAEPHWVAPKEVPYGENVETLERELADHLKLLVAGDLHHYRRHVRNGRQLVTAGGGGAFLHPTHKFDDDTDASRREQVAYPSRDQSARVSRWALAFPFLNGWFWLASGAIYGLFSMIILLSTREAMNLTSSLTIATDSLLSPALLTWAGLLIGGFVAFTDTSKRWYQYVGGFFHGTVHSLVAMLLPWTTAYVLWTAERVPSLPELLGVWIATTLAGAFIGGVVMGLYLYLSLTISGRHRNEAFSAIRHTGYKSFLRLHIDEQGVLHGVAFGLDKTPKFVIPRTSASGRAKKPRELVVQRIPWPAIKPCDAASCAPKVVDTFSIK